MLSGLLLAAQLISVAVLPSYCFDPCEFRVTLKVEPVDAKRLLVIQVEAPDSEFYLREDLEYTGRTPKTSTIRFPGIPAGNYMVKATICGRDESGKTVCHADYKTVRIIKQ